LTEIASFDQAYISRDFTLLPARRVR
jgi:hypothetical protein